MKQNEQYPVVLRFAPMHLADLGGYEMHRLRTGGDLEHVDQERSDQNRLLIGEADWATQLRRDIEIMKTHNHEIEIAKLKKRRRTAELKRLLQTGPGNPWRASKNGPLREVIITANKDWFSEGDTEARERQFEQTAKDWLVQNFGDTVVHARSDADEQAFHIHAIIAPKTTTKDGRRMLQPSAHPLIKNYEHAQDSVGQFFAKIGLVRGRAKARERRDAKQMLHDLQRSDFDGHVSPREWREDQMVELASRTKQLEIDQRRVKEKEKLANSILKIADAIATDDKDTIARAKRSQNATIQKAVSIFTRAQFTLMDRAMKAAEARFQPLFEGIQKAEQTILEASRGLPALTRDRVAQAHRRLTKQIDEISNYYNGMRSKLNNRQR